MLVNTWYATKDLMLSIHELKKTSYRLPKSNRLVDDFGGENPYERVEKLSLSGQELEQGRFVKVKEMLFE